MLLKVVGVLVFGTDDQKELRALNRIIHHRPEGIARGRPSARRDLAGHAPSPGALSLDSWGQASWLREHSAGVGCHRKSGRTSCKRGRRGV